MIRENLPLNSPREFAERIRRENAPKEHLRLRPLIAVTIVNLIAIDTREHHRRIRRILAVIRRGLAAHPRGLDEQTVALGEIERFLQKN